MIRIQTRSPLFCGLSCALMACFAVANASAAIIPFSQITNNGTESPTAQLTAEVSELAGQVLFKFVNAAGMDSLPSRISEVYWDDDLGLLSNGPVVDASNTSAGVVLTNVPANPGNLPSGNTIGFLADYSAGRKMSAANGVDPGEMAAFLFDGDTASVLAALDSGNLRLGMHVISIGMGGQSESFVNIPEPTAALLALVGLLAMPKQRS